MGKRPANVRQAIARRSHAAHQKFQKTVAAASGHEESGGSASSEFLDSTSPEDLARLEALDDAVFDAIQGKAAAWADLNKLWPVLKSEPDEALMAAAREQYIRYALAIWREPANSQGHYDPARAVRALEVLCVLFDEVR